MTKKEQLLLKRETAKIGMSVSLALTVGSAFFLRTQTGKQIHVGAGLALAGFSLWHHMLYDKNDSKKMLEAKKTIPPLGEREGDY